MKYFVLILNVLLVSGLFAQTVENGSFEDWETENGKFEPVNWSSIQTGLPTSVSSLAPKVLDQSTDAHTGNFSIRLENKSSFGIVANGTITNGRVFADLDPTKGYVYTDMSDSRWNTPLTLRPDSLVGWYRIEPVGGDIGQFKALLHTGEAKVPDADSINHIALALFETGSTPVSTWTRFSTPFVYKSNATPEYILMVFNSGNGTSAVAGTVMYVDDIELIYNFTGVEDVVKEDEINTYSTENQIVIDLGLVSGGLTFDMKVFDVMGRQIANKPLNAGTKSYIENIEPGIYICTFTQGESIISKKVVVL